MLGSFRVIVDGIPVEDSRWTRRQPKQMVKLLALQPHARLHREQAMEFLWPEEDQESASNNLHRTIHLARRALEPRLKTGADSRFILTREEQLLLRSPGRLWIDAHIFERKAIDALKSNEPADYEAALSLYQDDLLAEDPYEDLAARPRERLFDLWRNLLVRLAAILETQRHYDRGIEYLKKVLIRNLSDEEAHRHLMRLYALSGSKNKALAQYKLCC
ncbi:MAG TPA: BTAD domain-containing putative transcriptional regulator, partial [Pyrinomonadaceae bacterium]|nr:BTAD domain-containing putative transcriptional regulator [Pyrinomonadaceae bacterium]